MAEEIVENEETVDLDTSDTEEVEVELPEETDNSDQEEEPLQAEESAEKDDEHEQYSASVQKRIDRLTKKMREAERQREEALSYAQNVKKEAEELKTRVKSLDEGYMTEYGSRLGIEQQQVEAELKRAVDLGDSTATVAAQKRLTELAVAADRYNEAKRAQEARSAYEKQQPPPAEPPQPRRPDPKAEDWASKNSWFGQDEAMTFAAFGIHKKLVEDEQFDPKSDEYYSELDTRMRTEFPHKFTNENSTATAKKPVQNVAGGSRSSARSGRTRKLTPSQVAIAKKLGVPLEEYAKYVK